MQPVSRQPKRKENLRGRTCKVYSDIGVLWFISIFTAFLKTQVHALKVLNSLFYIYEAYFPDWLCEIFFKARNIFCFPSVS